MIENAQNSGQANVGITLTAPSTIPSVLNLSLLTTALNHSLAHIEHNYAQP